MENLTGGTPPVRYLPCVVPCKLYFVEYHTSIGISFFQIVCVTSVGSPSYSSSYRLLMVAFSFFVITLNWRLTSSMSTAVIDTFANLIAKGLRSTPIHFLFAFSASINVTPEPQKLSRTTSPGIVYFSINFDISLNFSRRPYSTPSTWGKVKGKMGGK